MNRRPTADVLRERACQVCGQAVHGAFVCTPCLDQLHGDLVAIPDEARDLLVELANQSRKGSHGLARSADTPLPYSPAASATLADLRNELVTACRTLALDDPRRLPGDTIDAMAAWLDRHVDSVGQRMEGGDICRGMQRVRKRVARIVDTPPERVYIGDCTTCTEAGTLQAMYAPRSETWHRCRDCGTVYAVAECLASLERFLSDYRLTAAEVEVVTGRRVKAARVRKWRERGQIDSDGEGKVRFGDVLALEARLAS